MAYTSIPFNAGAVWGPPVATTADLPATTTIGAARVVIADDAVYMYDGTAWRNTGSSGAGVMTINTVADGPNVVIQGTTNQISVNTTGDTLTLSTPQNINSTATPTFGGVTITNNAGVGTATVGTTLTLTAPGTGTGTALVRDAGGVVVELTSSIAFKENVRNLTKEHDVKDIVHKLVGRKYNYKDSSKEVSFGFIAEEVEKICKEVVVYKDGVPHSLNYNAFIPIITEYLKVIDEEQKRIVTKTKELDALLNKQLAVKVTSDVATSASDNSVMNNRYLPLVMSALAVVISIIIAYTR